MSEPTIHPTSVVEDRVRIGAGTKIWLFNHIMSGASIGENCQLGQNVYIGTGVKIGNGVKIQNNVSVYEEVELEDDVFCGPSLVFTNVINPRSFIPRKNEFKPTKVKKGATLGANATILCGHTLGRFCMVGAGSVITSDVPDHALFTGVPGRQSGWVCECGVKLEKDKLVWRCKECEKNYLEGASGLAENVG